MSDHFNEREERQMTGTPEGVPVLAPLAPAGLADPVRESSPRSPEGGRKGSRVPDLTKRTILTVWAADHVQPDRPVDGKYPYILSVRDLAPQRRQLQATVNRYRQEELAQRGTPDEALLSDAAQASVDRVAISRALKHRDYLRVTRRLVTPPIKPRSTERQFNRAQMTQGARRQT